MEKQCAKSTEMVYKSLFLHVLQKQGKLRQKQPPEVFYVKVFLEISKKRGSGTGVFL